jgi:hypothetical protein
MLIMFYLVNLANINGLLSQFNQGSRVRTIKQILETASKARCGVPSAYVCPLGYGGINSANASNLISFVFGEFH